MISFATLVNKMTGRTPQEPAQPNGSGAAPGGEFAELVRLAAQSGGVNAAGGDVNGLRLVSDNGTAFTPGAPTFASDAGIELVPSAGPAAIQQQAGGALPTLANSAHSVAAFAQQPSASSPSPAAIAKLASLELVDASAQPDDAMTRADTDPSADPSAETANSAPPLVAPQVIMAVIPAAPSAPSVFVQPETPVGGTTQRPTEQALAPNANPESAEPSAMLRDAMLRDAALRALPATPTGMSAATETQAADGPSILRPMMAPAYSAGFSAMTTTATDGKPTANPIAQANIAALAAAQTGEGMTPNTTTDQPAASPSSRAEGASRTTESASRLAPTDLMASSSPLRAIVDMLPPVIQAELGTATVRGVNGPSTADALGSQVIDMGVSGQWIDRMAREIAGLASGNGHSRFTLNPPHLGRLQVDIFQSADVTDVRLLAETDEATRRLAEGRPALQGDARMVGLQITVERASAQSDTPARDQGQSQRDLAGQAQQQQQGDRQAQSRGGQADRDSWVARTARDPSNQRDDADAAAATRGRTDSNVRFA